MIIYFKKYLYNNVNFNESSSKLSLYLFLEKPVFITKLKRETLSDYGSTVTLPCDVNGVPSPTLKWFRNAEPVDHLLGTRYAMANICLCSH